MPLVPISLEVTVAAYQSGQPPVGGLHVSVNVLTFPPLCLYMARIPSTSNTLACET